GVKPLYTVFMGSFLPGADQAWSLGVGLGSLIPLGGAFAFNPEVISHQAIRSNGVNLSGAGLLNWNLNPRFTVSAGPVWHWRYRDNREGPADYFLVLWEGSSSSRTRSGLGVRAGVRVNL
ncbi:MAG: hypothetical protein AAFV07_02000, partial [Bacteroidota bacterium]